ncbi:homoserine kinase [Hydrogenoanaerobacterium saccharovorans]|uniref:Homoserine kinase n=1 Tax=Hydrogenoanaerobacterium saccharovorans TaxID=474960 RepID=A0A1H8AD46_9FIRM|nr:homoserine kinase [Hydrogenoanaerobacterium saccharovorans]RPF48020.1 homoserine kinase [Hydrogenoanaerobacterium saccharovorans]SEM68473.1 homoserine kinase [Hydrogenoanaerobacterium saccharovorans]
MIKVQIPATSANIGAGFDSLGLAVSMYNYVNLEEQDSIEIVALDGVPIPTDESNLVYQCVKYIYDLCDKPLKGIRIEQINNIPMARGLGSSSACIVGGLVGANAMLGNPLRTSDLVNIAATMEGHPDNSTPALLGGLVTAVLENGKVYYVKQEIAEDLRFVTIIPDFELKTKFAREALPKEIPHKDGVFNLSRAALMSVSLYSRNYQNLRIAADDRLHQPYRLSLINGAHDVLEMSYKHGAYASYISGAGSTLMSIISSGNFEFEGIVREYLQENGLDGWKVNVLSIDNEGTRIIP